MGRTRNRGVTPHDVTALGAHISVNGSTLHVRSGGVDQSVVNLARPEILEFEYLQHIDLLVDLTLPLLDTTRPRAFHAGAGGCALPLAWEARYPHMSQVAVEVDAQLAAATVAAADLRRKPRLRMRVGDAADVLTGSGATYTILVRDAFTGSSTPRHLTTTAWTELVRSRMRSGGMYLANVGQDRHSRAKEEVATILAAFPQTIVVTDPKVWRANRSGNIVVAAWSGAIPDLEDIDRNLRRMPLPVRLYPTAEVERWLGGARPLTH